MRWLRLVVLGVATLLYGWLAVASSRARLDAPAPTTVLVDRDGVFLAELAPDPTVDGAGYWPVDALPWRVVACTIALEDSRFASHPGIDPLGVARALGQNVASGRVVSGGSTIAMQVARMQHPGARTLPNKLMEATVALLLVGAHGRDAVLAHYLTVAPYGNGAHGIAFASWRYFDKPVADLSWAETALLVAIPQSPSRMDPYDAEGRARAIARGHRVLGFAHAQGLMDDVEYALAETQIDALRPVARRGRPTEAMHVIVGEHADGLRVASSIDLDVQGLAHLALRDAVRAGSSRGVGNGAVMVLDVDTGEVLASVGSTDYFDDRRSGAIDFSTIRRSPGSALKPFVYAAALDRGLAPNQVLDDLARAPDGTGNADDRFLGPMLPRMALGNSRNVPALALVADLGIDETFDVYRTLGLHDGVERPRGFGLGLAVGSLPVRMTDLAGAYLTLAGDGRRREPQWRAGAVAPRGARVFSEQSTRTVATWLSDPMARLPSFPRRGALEYPFPVAVKTGTSEDARDAWVAAWSERYLVLAWVGDPHHQPMVDVSGAVGAARIAHDVLMALHRDEVRLADHGFTDPDGLPVPVCAATGGRATEACEHAITERLDAVPPPCTAHRHEVVNGERRTIVDLGPRYAAWQAAHGVGGPGVRSEADSAVVVAAPRSGSHYVRDPAVPAAAATIALSATVDPPAAQVVWYVDGEPFETVDWPYEARWTLVPGEHHFEARVPFTELASSSVRVTVQ